jgi:hypothetical protein
MKPEYRSQSPGRFAADPTARRGVSRVSRMNGGPAVFTGPTAAGLPSVLDDIAIDRDNPCLDRS